MHYSKKNTVFIYCSLDVKNMLLTSKNVKMKKFISFFILITILGMNTAPTSGSVLASVTKWVPIGVAHSPSGGSGIFSIDNTITFSASSGNDNLDVVGSRTVSTTRTITVDDGQVVILAKLYKFEIVDGYWWGFYYRNLRVTFQSSIYVHQVLPSGSANDQMNLPSTFSYGGYDSVPFSISYEQKDLELIVEGGEYTEERSFSQAFSLTISFGLGGYNIGLAFSAQTSMSNSQTFTQTGVYYVDYLGQTSFASILTNSNPSPPPPCGSGPCPI